MEKNMWAGSSTRWRMMGAELSMRWRRLEQVRACGEWKKRKTTVMALRCNYPIVFKGSGSFDK
jgi:hypothetical protein